MRRLKQLSGRALLSLALTSGALLAPVLPLIAVGSLTVTQTSCGPSDLSKLHDILNKTAKTLNTAVKTNGTLYEKGFYGPVGSAEAVARLHRGAQIVKDANGHLITALNLAQGLTKETFEQGKLAVLEALTQAVQSMPSTGNQTMDLVLQSVATLISQAVAIVQLFQSRDLKIVLPEIKTWKLPEVNV